MKNENVDSHDCRDEDFLARAPRGPMRTRQRTIPVFGIAFALAAVLLLSLTSFAPAVQALSEEYLDDYSFTPSGTSESEPLVGDGSVTLDESAIPEEPRTIDSLPDLGHGSETRSFYTQVDPLLMDVLFRPSPDTVVTDGTGSIPLNDTYALSSSADSGKDYWNVNTYGRYRFGSEDFSRMTLLEDDTSILTSSYFDVRSENGTSLGPAAVQERSSSIFVTSQPLSVDGTSVGSFFVKSEFLTNDRPKVSAWISTGSEYDFEIVWNIRLDEGYVRTSEGVFSVSNLTDSGHLPAESMSFEYGSLTPENRWRGTFLVDWSDAGCGNLSIVEDTDGCAARIVFPRGMHSVDPTLVATSECSYATSGSPFRNTVYYSGTYWLFYGSWDGLFYVRSADNGATWSQSTQLPIGSYVERPGMFDVAIHGSHIAVASLWRDYSAGEYNIGFIDGYISGSSIQWNSWTSARDMPDSMFGWFGGVSLGADGAAYVCYAEAIASILVDIRLVTLQKLPYSPSFVELDNHFPEYSYPNLPSEDRPFLRPRVITTSDDSVVFMELVGFDDPLVPAELTVTSPNGGEAWTAGTQHTITWTSSGAGANVKIELVRPGVTLTIDLSDPNDGSYLWSIAPDQAASSEYTIRITDTSDSSIVDQSDSTFTVVPRVPIQVVSPNGGESWQRGKQYPITWGGTAGSVRIDLLDVGSGLLTTLANNYPNTGVYPWSISPTQAIDVDYKMKITDLQSMSIDYSNSVFSIIPLASNSITVISPNGGESWLRGSTQQIKWTSTGPIDVSTSLVKIELLSSGMFAATVDSSEPNDGIYEWTIPSDTELRGDFSVRVTSVSYPTVYDTSNAPFAITYDIPSDWLDSCSIIWNVYRPESSTWQSLAPWTHPMALDSVDQFSVCPGGKDEIHLACLSSSGSLGYYRLWLDEDGLPVGSYTDLGVTALTWPSISLDPNEDVHIQYSMSGRVYELHAYPSEDTWAPSVEMGTGQTYTVSCLSSGEKLESRNHVSFVNALSATSSQIMFGALPLPADIIGPYGDPWSGGGINQDQPFNMGVSDVVSPGNGLLYLFQNDFVIPGRGTDIVVSHFYSTPQYFAPNSAGTLMPYLYDTFPYSSLGEGWQLNFPWVDDDYVHLWSGTKIKMEWKGDYFNNTKGQQFTMVKLTDGFRLDLQDGMRIEFNSDGSPARIFANRAIDSSNPDIIFSYTTTAAGKRIYYVRDHLSRYVYFNHLTDGKLNTITRDGCSVTFLYTGSQLTGVRDPLNRVTGFQYATVGYPSILLETVTYPSSLAGNAYITYGYESIDVGSDALAYVVDTRIMGYEGWKSYSYTAVDGIIRSTYVGEYSMTPTDRWIGDAVYDFDSGSKATTVTYFGLNSYEYPYGSTRIPLKRTVSWYSPDGRVSRSETYDDFRKSPDHSTAYVDNKGNTIYTKDPLGHEAFSSFANTTTGNSFFRPAELASSSSGRVFYDNFGDWNFDGWTKSSGGTVQVNDYLSDESYMPSCRLWASSGTFYVSVDLNPDGAGLNEVILDTLLQIPSTNSDMRLVFTDDAGVTMTGARFASGYVYYFDSSGAWIATTTTYSANTLYRVTMCSDISSGLASTKFYLNGVYKATFTRTVSAELMAQFRVQQVYVGTSPFCTLDNVKIMKDYAVTINGLQEGKFVELYDNKGNLVERVKATGSQVVLSLDYTDSFIPYGNFVIRNDTGVVELLDTYREIWGGDNYTYGQSQYLRSAISKATSGIDTGAPLVLDDYFLLSPVTTMTSTFSFVNNPNLVLSGTKYHHDAYTAGVGWHGYRAPTGSYPSSTPIVPSTGFFIQMVYIPLDAVPLEIGLRYYYTFAPTQVSGWTDMAAWGTPAIILDDVGEGVLMGELPAPGQWVMLLVKGSDVGWPSGYNVCGLNFTHLGGDPYFDKTSCTSDPDFGKISLSNVAIGNRVELRRPNGELVAASVASSSTVTLDLYSAGVRAFPLSASFTVYDSSGQVVSESPVFRDIYPKDVFTFSAANSPFYANANTPEGFGGLAAGTMQFTDAAHTVSMESYYRYGRLSGTSWVETSLVTQSKTKDGTVWRTTSYSYDPYGNVLKVTDPSGAMLNYTYEQSGTYLDSSWIIVRSETGLQNLSTKFDYYSNGLLKTETDAKGYTTTYTYDSVGRPTMITYPSLSGTVVSVDYLYDNVNQIVTFQDEINTKRKTYYDGYGRVWKEQRLLADGTTSYSSREYTYCWNGRVDSIKDSGGRTTAVDYDYFGRIVKTYNSDDTACRTVYDDRNRTVSQYDELGNRKDSTYDANGRLVSAIQYFGSTKLYTNTTYDDVGNILSVTDSAGLRTTYNYDNMGRLKGTYYPFGDYEICYYDAAGGVQRVDRSGTSQDIVYTYDTAGRLTKRYFDSYNCVNLTYDANGNVIYSLSANRAGTVSTSSTYDEWNRVKDEVTSVDGTSYKVTYGYDTRSNIESIDALSGTYLLSFTYDEFNRAKTATLKSGRSTISLASFAYNDRDQMTSTNYGNGVVTTYEIDTLRGWIDRINVAKSGTTLLDLSYADRDSTGRITRINSYRTYVYDSLGRLTYANDTSAYGRFAFTYDTYGNRQTMTWGSTVTTYYYDGYKRLQTSVTGTSATSFGYDSLRGNLWYKTDATSDTEFFYNVDDRMYLLREDGVDVGFYAYDASGRRVKSVEDGTSDITIYSGSLPLVTISGGGKKTVQTLHAYVNGIHIAKYVSKVPYYYHLDHLGSVRLVTDQYGAVVFDTDYLPFGEPYMPDGTEAFLYADARTSKYAGLISFGARDYDPETGRFTTPDPVLGALSTPTSLNRWVYCLNDPINRMDKYGTWSWDISLDSVIDIGGALLDSAVSLVGDAIEFAVDTVVEVVETAIEVIDDAVDVAEQCVVNAIRAADAVCSAVVAGCTAIKLAWDNLDPGLKQWIVMGLSIAVSFMPVVGPIISCIIDGSFVDMYNAIRTGDWGMLALSLTAFIPGGKALKGLKAVGGLGKFSRVAKGAPMMSDAVDTLVKKGTRVFRAGDLGKFMHGGSYSLKSMQGMSRGQIRATCGIPASTGNPLTHHLEFVANQDFYAKAGTSVNGAWPELRLMPGQGGQVLDFVGATRILP